MHTLMVMDLAELRRRELLLQAQRERRALAVRRARRAAPRPGATARGWDPRGWRGALGLFLVRLGVRLGAGTLADSMVVVSGRGGRSGVRAVIWRDPGAARGEPPSLRPVGIGQEGRSPSRH